MRPERIRTAWKCGLLIGLLSSVAWAATATQLFVVDVPVRVIIKAPPLDQFRSYPGTGSANVVFAPQSWWAAGNSTRGVNVILETATSFRHTTVPLFRRDARLDLTASKIKGRGNWTVNTASDRTNFLFGDENARVRASSNGSGEANLFLTVTFLTTTPLLLLEGDYTTTVVGTITEN